MKYIAQFKIAVQISPDDWEMQTPTLELNDDTTIGQIRKWMADGHRGQNETEFKVIVVDEGE